MSFPSIKTSKPALSRAMYKLSSKVPFSSAIPALQDILKIVDKYPALYTNRSVLSNAIRRYESCWLPLQLAHPDTSLVPPIDVHWVWICHMLNPIAYARDVRLVAASACLHSDRLVDHCLIPNHARGYGLLKAEDVWNTYYPNEKFDVSEMLAQMPIIASASDNEQLHLPSAITYDIMAAASRLMSLHYQLCIMPQYSDSVFLKQAIKRYLKHFLYLKRMYPKQVMSPPYDIDLVWYCHMLHPVRYVTETRRIVGLVLPHDDTINDRSPDSDLKMSWKNTCTLWKQRISNLGPSVNGAAFRGNVTSSERSLRRSLQAYVAGTRSHFYNYLPGETVAEIEGITKPRQKTTASSSKSPQTAWVHLPNASRINPSAPALNRYSKLVLPTKNSKLPKLTCSVMHRVINTASTNRKCRKISSAVEICSMTDAENLPLATAHMMDNEQMVGSAEQLSRNAYEGSVLKEHEKALMLRISGEDAAILIGKWTFSHASTEGRNSSTAVKNAVSHNSRGEGRLELRMCVLNTGVTNVRQTAQWQVVESAGGNPRRYNFDISGFSECKAEDYMCVDIAQGRILCNESSNLLLGYLLAMATSMLHVVLQPRYSPNEAQNSWYPSKKMQQKGFKMLEACGGEVMGHGHRNCYGEIGEFCYGEASYVHGSGVEYRRRVRWSDVANGYVLFDAAGDSTDSGAADDISDGCGSESACGGCSGCF